MPSMIWQDNIRNATLFIQFISIQMFASQLFRLLKDRENVHLIDPLDYEPFVWAMDRCYFLLSDSGGIQEESLHLGKPIFGHARANRAT